MVEPAKLFATAATADMADAAVGIVWWATDVDGYALKILDYDFFDVSAINADWIGTYLDRCVDLVAKHKPADRECHLRVEHPGLVNILKRADDAYREIGRRGIDRAIFDIKPIKTHEAAKWPLSLDERAFSIRPLVDSGKVIKIETGLKRFTFRSIKTNHLLSAIKRHRPGDSTTASELLHAFVLGVLLGTTRQSMTYFEAIGKLIDQGGAKPAPSANPFFGPYIPGRPR